MEKKESSSIEMGNIEFHHALMSEDNYDPIVALGFNPSVAHHIPDSEAINFLYDDNKKVMAGMYVPDTLNYGNVSQAFADAQEAAGGPVTVESGEDLVMTFGSFANKSAVWNHEFRHRGLRILRQEYSDDEIMERVPLSFMERLRDFAGRSINKTKVMEGLLDSMSKPDGQEWLMAAYDDFDNVGSGVIDESKLLTPDQVTEFMDALNSLANDHLERIQKEKYETNLRKRGLDSEPVFNPTNRAGSGGISSTFIDTEESMLQ